MRTLTNWAARAAVQPGHPLRWVGSWTLGACARLYGAYFRFLR